jgi:hypothetical protein
MKAHNTETAQIGPYRCDMPIILATSLHAKLAAMRPNGILEWLWLAGIILVPVAVLVLLITL